MKLPASFAYCFSTGTHHGKAIGWNSEREREPNECTRKLPSNAQEKLDEIMGIGQHGNMQQKMIKMEFRVISHACTIRNQFDQETAVRIRER